MRPLTDIRVAVGFLTRVPVGDVTGGDPSSVRIADAVPWFPLVGAAIGLAHGAAWLGLVELLAPLPAAAIASAAALLITGAFHHDGLADMADAFGGGWTVEQRFEILKDSRLGTYGTSALAMALIIEITATAELSGPDGLWTLVGAHAAGRAVAVLTMLMAPTAGDGLGASYMRDISTVRAIVGIAGALAIVVFTSPVLVVWPLLGAAVAAAAVVGLAIRKIGGVTGDVLGAIAVAALVTYIVVTASLV